MALSSYLVLFIAMAVATIAILTLGTLAAADLLPRRDARHEVPGSQDGREPRSIAHRDGAARRRPLALIGGTEPPETGPR